MSFLLLSVLTLCAAKPTVSLENVLLNYRVLELALANDSLKEAAESSKKVWEAAQGVVKSNGVKGDNRRHLERVVEKAKALSSATEEKAVRSAFEGLSESVVAIVKADRELRKKWRLYFCPMYSGYNRWVQLKEDGKLMNPYWGNKMQQCGAEVEWET